MEQSPYIGTASLHRRDRSNKVVATKFPGLCSTYRADDSRQEKPIAEDPKRVDYSNDHNSLSIRRELPSLSPRRRESEKSFDLSNMSDTRSTLEDQWVLKRCNAWSEDSIEEGDFFHHTCDTKDTNYMPCFQRRHSILADSPGRAGEIFLYLEDRVEGALPLQRQCTPSGPNDVKGNGMS